MSGRTMGALVGEQGVTFRVWAPHARGVTVAGSFNDWSSDADPLTAEHDGHWTGLVATAADGDEYKFVISTTGGEPLWRNDPYARDVTRSDGNSIVCAPHVDWEPAGYRSPSWDELVIYELHVGTFADVGGGPPGNFDSVVGRLPHLRELGVNAIELMPPMEFPADVSWGYNPAHIFAVEEAFGGPAALERFVAAAHAEGIAVILDVVYNHLGPGDLDLWRFDGWSENDMGGIYFYNDPERARTPWAHTRPDYGRAEVVRFLSENAAMWLHEFHLDGLRWDATAYIRNTEGNDNDPAHDLADGWRLMQRVTRETDEQQPWKLHVAEDLRNNDWLTRPVGEGGAGFDTQWDADFVHPVRRILTEPWDEQRNMASLAAAIARSYPGGAWRRVIYTESHDEVANGHARVPQEIAPSDAGGIWARKRSTLGAVLVFTSPGIPMLFQGQELLEDEWFREDVPMDWSRVTTYSGILQLYRDLIRLRRDWWGTTRGLRGEHVNVHHVNDDDKVIAYHRWHSGGPGDDVVIVVNAANRVYDSYRIGLPRAGRWRVRCNTDWRGYSDDFDDHPGYDTMADGGPTDGMARSANVGIGRYAALVLSQDE